MEAAMELDDLKSAWQSLDQRLAQQNALQLAELRDRKLGAARASLRPLAWGQVALMLFGIAVLLLGIDTWTSHRDNTVLFVCGLVMHIYGVLVVIGSGSTLGLIKGIDYSAPVLTIQRQLAHLRLWYIGVGMVTGLPWFLLWMTALVCIVRLPYAPAWFWPSAVIGLTGLLATLAFHFWLRRPGREKLARSMDDSAAGRSLVQARSFLEDVARFERTDQDR